MTQPEIPAEITADYANETAEQALADFTETPDWEHLAAFLNAVGEGYLVVDVTGSGGAGGSGAGRGSKNSRKKGTRIRTIRSTKGQLVLPLFTSMAALRNATAGQNDKARGAVMPAREALKLIHSDRFVAAEFNPSQDKLVILRKYVDLVADGETVTAEQLEAMR